MKGPDVTGARHTTWGDAGYCPDHHSNHHRHNAEGHYLPPASYPLVVAGIADGKEEPGYRRAHGAQVADVIEKQLPFQCAAIGFEEKTQRPDENADSSAIMDFARSMATLRSITTMNAVAIAIESSPIDRLWKTGYPPKLPRENPSTATSPAHDRASLVLTSIISWLVIRGYCTCDILSAAKNLGVGWE